MSIWDRKAGTVTTYPTRNVARLVLRGRRNAQKARNA